MNTTELIHQQVETPQSESLVQELIMKRYEHYQLDKQQNSEPLKIVMKRLKQKYNHPKFNL